MKLHPSVTYFINKFYIKCHTYLILSGTAFTGFVSSKILLDFNFKDPSLRYPLAFLLSYLVFLFLMYVWMNDVRRELSPVDKEVLSKLLHTSDSVNTKTSSQSDGVVDGLLSGVEIADNEILGGILSFFALFFIIGSILYFIFDTLPILFIELLLTSMTAAFFNTSIKKFDRNIFIFSLFKSSIPPAILVGLFYFFLGKILHETCPSAVKISDIFTLGCIK